MYNSRKNHLAGESKQQNWIIPDKLIMSIPQKYLGSSLNTKLTFRQAAHTPKGAAGGVKHTESSLKCKQPSVHSCQVSTNHKNSIHAQHPARLAHTSSSHLPGNHTPRNYIRNSQQQVQTRS